MIAAVERVEKQSLFTQAKSAHPKRPAPPASSGENEEKRRAEQAPTKRPSTVVTYLLDRNRTLSEQESAALAALTTLLEINIELISMPIPHFLQCLYIATGMPPDRNLASINIAQLSQATQNYLLQNEITLTRADRQSPITAFCNYVFCQISDAQEFERLMEPCIQDQPHRSNKLTTLQDELKNLHQRLTKTASEKEPYQILLDIIRYIAPENIYNEIQSQYAQALNRYNLNMLFCLHCIKLKALIAKYLQRQPSEFENVAATVDALITRLKQPAASSSSSAADTASHAATPASSSNLEESEYLSKREISGIQFLHQHRRHHGRIRPNSHDEAPVNKHTKQPRQQ